MAQNSPRVNIELDGAKAFKMTTADRVDAGYIYKWVFDSGEELTADLTVPNPENPDSKIKVVAVLDKQQFWEGGRTDTKFIRGRISEDNRSMLKTTMLSQKGSAEQKISLKIYRYNTKGKVYYEYLGYEDAPVVFAQNEERDVEAKACDDVRQPPNHSFVVAFTPKGDAPEHEFRSAEGPLKNVIVPWGGVGA